MSMQSTRCASEELAELEEWLNSKGIYLADKDVSDLQPGEYVKALNEPSDADSGESPLWTVTWHPIED